MIKLLNQSGGELWNHSKLNLISDSLLLPPPPHLDLVQHDNQFEPLLLCYKFVSSAATVAFSCPLSVMCLTNCGNLNVAFD